MEREGRILVTMTRWHSDDLMGRILKQESDKWVHLNFPAIPTEDNINPEYDEREVGEALWENRHPIRRLEKSRVLLGLRDFEALYQGSPIQEGGNIFKAEWFDNRYQQLPKINFIVQSLDTAFKEKEESDFTALQTWGLGKNGVYLLDSWRGKVDYPKLVRITKDKYAQFNPNLILIEDKASGQSLVQSLKAETMLPIVPVRADKSKVSRANSTTGLFASGRVWLPESAGWIAEYVQEMLAFPSGDHDDQVDSTTQFLNWCLRELNEGVTDMTEVQDLTAIYNDGIEDLG